MRGLAEDQDGIVWFGTDVGLSRFDSATGSFVHYRHDPADPTSLSEGMVSGVAVDRSNTIWALGRNTGVNRLERSTGAFTHYRHDPTDPLSLSDNFVASLLQDRSGAMWIGTISGLNRLDPGSGIFVRYTAFDHLERNVASGLPDDTIYELYEDDSGRLWMSINGGIVRFDPQSGVFTTYGLGDGL